MAEDMSVICSMVRLLQNLDSSVLDAASLRKKGQHAVLESVPFLSFASPMNPLTVFGADKKNSRI